MTKKAGHQWIKPKSYHDYIRLVTSEENKNNIMTI